MEHPDPKLWHEFFVTLGTADAALMGLLFVANSLHLQKLLSDALLQRRSRNLLLVMMLLFVQSLAILVPQDRVVLGVEVIVLNLIYSYFPISVILRMAKDRLHVPVVRIITGIVAALGTVAGGMLLMADWRWSLHLIAAANVLTIFVVVSNAWVLMLGQWQTELLGEKQP